MAEGVGVESTRDRVSGGEDCNGEASDSSRQDWSVTAESEVPSTGSVLGVGEAASAEEITEYSVSKEEPAYGRYERT